MQNFSTFPKSRKYALLCQLPDCNCEKCQKLRSEGKPDQSIRKESLNVRSGNIKRELLEKVEASVSENASLNRPACTSTCFGIGNCFTIPNLTPSDLESFLFDIVGIVSFFIMGSLMFWLTVSQYLWYFGKMVFQSGRIVKLLVSILILLLAISITCHAVKGWHKHRHNIPLQSKPSVDIQSEKNTTETEPQCEKNKEQLAPCNDSLAKKKSNPSLCDLCAKTFKSQSNSQTLLSDEELLEMIKTYKLHSAPSEMKFPPSFTNIMEVISRY